MAHGFRAIALLGLLLLAATTTTTSAQEECTQQVAEALKSSATEKETLKKEVTSCKDSYTKLYASWQVQGADIDKLKGTVSDLTSKLSTAQEQLSKPSSLDLPTIGAALVTITKEGALAAFEEGKAIFEGLKVGNTDRLMSCVGGVLTTFRGAASSAVSFVKSAADKHLPDSVKQKAASTLAQAQALWKQHVSDAAWAQPLLAKLSSVNEELKKLVGSTLAATPALAPLADPVTVQLLVYAVFALPALLLLVLSLVLAGDKKKPAAEARAGGSSKGKKKPAKK